MCLYDCKFNTSHTHVEASEQQWYYWAMTTKLIDIHDVLCRLQTFTILNEISAITFSHGVKHEPREDRYRDSNKWVILEWNDLWCQVWKLSPHLQSSWFCQAPQHTLRLENRSRQLGKDSVRLGSGQKLVILNKLSNLYSNPIFYGLDLTRIFFTWIYINKFSHNIFFFLSIHVIFQIM